MTDYSQWSVAQLLCLRIGSAVLMAALGSAVVLFRKTVSHRSLCLLISFAAGALLAVALFDIVPESVGMIGWPKALASVFSGYLLFFAITRFVFHVCPACAATHTEARFKAITLSMIAALSVHSFLDGLAIYSGFLTGARVGTLIFLAVAYHKFPEGMALTLVGIGSGMSRIRAFLICVLLEAGTTAAGGIAGLAVLLQGNLRCAGYVLGHVSGGFMYLVIHALLSEFIKHHPRSTVIAALAGGLSILFVGMLTGVR